MKQYKFLFIIFLIVSFTNAKQSNELRKEALDKRAALLEIKTIALEEEVEQLELERIEWERRKHAEQIIQNLDEISETDLNKEQKINNIINSILSNGFSSFLNKMGRKNKKAKLVILLFTINNNGEISNIQFQKSKVHEKKEKTVVKILKKLNFKELKGMFSSHSFSFPLLLDD